MKTVTSTTSSNVQPAAFRIAFRLSNAQPDLRLQVGLGRAVLAAADLPRNEQKAVGANRRRIAVALVQRLAAGRENDITLLS